MSQIRLAYIYLQQAYTARNQSDVKESIRHFEKALDIYKRMAAGDRACYELVADVIEQIAATYKAAGQLDKAEETFKEAATLREAMLKSEKPEEEG